MPELPDLEVQTHNLTKLLAGRTVEAVRLVRPKRVHPGEDGLERALKGAKIKAFKRAGKQMRVEFSNGHTLGIHLMLNGEIHVCCPDEKAKNVTAEFTLDNGQTLDFTDRQAWITLELDPSESDVPDALDKEFTLEYFSDQVSRKPKMPIKMLLVDQDVVQGIGNAYSDEILWHAKVDPASPCKNLPGDVVKRIYEEIPKTLRSAINEMRKAHSGIIFGEPRDHMAVHNNGKDVSPTGKAIETKEVKGKKTYYTQEQRAY